MFWKICLKDPIRPIIHLTHNHRLKPQKRWHDIETLIQHFLMWLGPRGFLLAESCVTIEATKGLNAYYLTSDGGTMSYRTRIRTPSFPHLQMIPMMCRGMMVAT